MNMPDFNVFIHTTWSLPWRFRDSHRAAFSHNLLRLSILQDIPDLSKSYNMKALQIRGIPPNAAVYIAVPDSTSKSEGLMHEQNALTEHEYAACFRAIKDSAFRV